MGALPVAVQDESHLTQGRPDFRVLDAINPLQLRPVPSLRDSGFGAGRATIVAVALCDAQGQTLTHSEGGRPVVLRVEALLHEDLDDLVFGYFLRNRLGLNVFGDNTYLAFAQSPCKGRAGERFAAEFAFVMPFLPKGEYAVCVALATGSNAAHEQQHWLNQALLIETLDNHVHAALLALPSLSMRIERL